MRMLLLGLPIEREEKQSRLLWGCWCGCSGRSESMEVAMAVASAIIVPDTSFP
jgi:hypothetical protein